MDTKQAVKDRYGKAALRVVSGGSGCCGTSPEYIRRLVAQLAVGS